MAQTQWPEDTAGVKTMLDQMPKRVAGARLSEGPMVDGPYAYLSYGPANEGGIVVMVVASNEEVRDPRANLSAAFGLGAVCRKDSYAGTAPSTAGSSPKWVVPDIGATGPDVEGLWWFSCDFMAGEEETFSGNALGWVSGDLAWLVTAPDKPALKSTVEALQSRAAG